MSSSIMENGLHTRPVTHVHSTCLGTLSSWRPFASEAEGTQVGDADVSLGQVCPRQWSVRKKQRRLSTGLAGRKWKPIVTRAFRRCLRPD